MNVPPHLDIDQIIHLIGAGILVFCIVGGPIVFAYHALRQRVDPNHEAPFGETRAEKAKRIKLGHRYGWIDEEAMTDEEWRDWQGQRSW